MSHVVVVATVFTRRGAVPSIIEVRFNLKLGEFICVVGLYLVDAIDGHQLTLVDELAGTEFHGVGADVGLLQFAADGRPCGVVIVALGHSNTRIEVNAALVNLLYCHIGALNGCLVLGGLIYA